tara:strand:- start:415 stop:954 length:540 start_codon:yes stop_codon:yes gene_type:complete
MNFFYDLFKSNNIIENDKEDDKEDDSLISTNYDINNICMSININTSKTEKKREYDTEFINYNKVQEHNFKLYIYENNVDKYSIIKSSNYYVNISGEYYIEFIKNFKLFNNKGLLTVFVKDEFEKQICSINFNYKLNNNFEYNNDIIKINIQNNSFYMYLKKNKDTEFYVYKFVYYKNIN